MINSTRYMPSNTISHRAPATGPRQSEAPVVPCTMGNDRLENGTHVAATIVGKSDFGPERATLPQIILAQTAPYDQGVKAAKTEMSEATGLAASPLTGIAGLLVDQGVSRESLPGIFANAFENGASTTSMGSVAKSLGHQIGPGGYILAS